MKFKLSDQQMSTSMGSESVILNHVKGEYYSLDAVGSVVWKILKNGPADMNELCQEVCTEFEVEADACRHDLEILLKDLISEKLVESLG